MLKSASFIASMVSSYAQSVVVVVTCHDTYIYNLNNLKQRDYHSLFIADLLIVPCQAFALKNKSLMNLICDDKSSKSAWEEEEKILQLERIKNDWSDQMWEFLSLLIKS